MKPNMIYFQSKGFPEFRFLSNFHVCTFSDDQGVYKSVEHFYQAAKADTELERQEILEAMTPGDAMRLGKKVKLPVRWDSTTRILIMTDGVLKKFFQNPELAEMLLATEEFELVEYAPWGDTFWGVGKDYVGENNLGKILMQTRDFLKAAK